MAALLCGAVILIAFLAFWLFGHNVKVGRSLVAFGLSEIPNLQARIAAELGQQQDFLSRMLGQDPKLLIYRIFWYDAYKAAIVISFGAIPLSMLGIWLARRGKRLALASPQAYGGLRMARASYALTVALFVIFSAVAVSAIPNAIERGRARRIAATHAQMYGMHVQALQKYHREYGAYPGTVYTNYPGEVSDLLKVNVDGLPRTDLWGNNFDYKPDAEIASNGAFNSFTNYKLVSAGPDGKFNTPDDIIMIDGVIVNYTPELEMSVTSQERLRP